jgi:thiamine biosynthesis protein ThiS
MRLTVNGQQKEFNGVTCVEELLSLLKVNKEGSAAELNGEIIAQKDWQAAKLNDGDKIEIITFVGGG